jgi:hypothetical protein
MRIEEVPLPRILLDVRIEEWVLWTYEPICDTYAGTRKTLAEVLIYAMPFPAISNDEERVPLYLRIYHESSCTICRKAVAYFSGTR